MPAFDLGKCEVFVMKSKDFWGKFFKLDLKVQDRDGAFGADKFAYFIYASIEQVDKYGCSPAYILVHTQKSLEHMKDDIRDVIGDLMENKYDINIDEVEEQNSVIVATDSNRRALVGRSSFSVYFPPREREDHQPRERENHPPHEREERNGTDAKLVRRGEGHADGGERSSTEGA